MAHTPGPWEAIVEVPDSRKRNKVYARPMALVRAGGTTCIDCTDSGDNYRQDCANASLIAAAPDLLEALEELVNTPQPGRVQDPFERTRVNQLHQQVMARARAALKKARGE